MGFKLGPLVYFSQSIPTFLHNSQTPHFWHITVFLHFSFKLSCKYTLYFLCFFFQLHSNPWNCDCHLKNFRDWVVFRGLYTYPTSCAEPERLADKLWQDVDPKDFACKPEIRIPQDVVFSQPGANVTLSCFIIGNPMPDAKWVLKVNLIQ